MRELFWCVILWFDFRSGSSVTLAQCRARALPWCGAELRVTVLMKATYGCVFLTLFECSCVAVATHIWRKTNVLLLRVPITQGLPPPSRTT